MGAQKATSPQFLCIFVETIRNDARATTIVMKHNNFLECAIRTWCRDAVIAEKLEVDYTPTNVAGASDSYRQAPVILPPRVTCCPPGRAADLARCKVDFSNQATRQYLPPHGLR